MPIISAFLLIDLDCPYLQPANNFTNFYGFIWLGAQVHKFKVVEERWSN